MALLDQPLKRGTKPTTRYHLDPAFVRHVYESGKPVWLLALTIGFPGTSSLSHILRAGTVIGSPLNLGRIALLARQVGYPEDEIFAERTEEVVPA